MAGADIFVRNIIKNRNSILYEFDYSNNLRTYFNPQEQFFIDYDIDKANSNISTSEFYLDKIPDGVLVIPFLCNVLTIAWVLNATIHVNEIDRNFYESIPEFKKGYEKMYPLVDFSGDIIARKITDHAAIFSGGGTASFFSGGVDAFNTLISHYEEKPLLMTLWGSDVFFNDIRGWDNVRDHVHKTAEQFGLEYILIKSNFRKFLNENSLNKLIEKRAKDGWWHGFQCGIGLIGHAAPVAYFYNSEKIYSASSYTIDYKGPTAAYPSIENNVKFSNAKIIHDGFEFSRQNKIENICKFVAEKQTAISLRVCWQSSGGKNCCRCEKCWRTMMGILGEGYDPNKYGLIYNKHSNKMLRNYLLYKYKMSEVIACFWKDIQSRFAENNAIFKKRPELEWIIKVNFNTINNHPVKLLYDLMKRIFNKILRG
jgi:hypothetical protein